jgi:sec-independent protein translocase protein TatC
MTEPPDSGDLPSDEPKPFLDHLEELRWTLVRCVIALVAGMALCIPAVPLIIKLLKSPLRAIDPKMAEDLIILSPTGVVGVILRVGAWSGLLISFPFVLYFITRFVFPGLTGKERNVIRKASGFAAGLFILGVFLGFAVCTPLALQMLIKFHVWIGMVPQWTTQYYIIFVIQLMIGFGLAFQMPVIVLILGKLGLVSHQQLREKRRHVLLGCFVVGMFLTPAEIVSQVVMAVPLYLLFEMCIWILWLDDRRRGEDAGDIEKVDS